ncbi:unnamed protein product [Calicophoron daubneyi]|uniref:Uncharacterized protein n=1 Tax=Calicophoron daubneyi TaxID=300641 RepID=A0AAV2SZF9_CALDB
MGAGVDAETKQRSQPDQNWLVNLDQCTLSWSYGLAALSFPGTFVTLIILGWFVYPKRSKCGLLSVNAWDWPTKRDLLCRQQLDDLRIGSHSYCSHSFASIDPLNAPSRPQSASTGLHMHSLVSQSKPTLVSVRPQSGGHSSAHGLHENRHVEAPTTTADLLSPDLANISKLSCHDPRSPDSISLLSYDHTPSVEHLLTPRDVSDEQAMAMRRSINNRTYRISNHHSARAGAGDRTHELDSPVPLSSTTLALDAPVVEPTAFVGRHTRLKSSHGGADSSLWTSESTVQVARPMNKGSRKSLKSSKISGSTVTLEEPSMEMLPVDPTPRPAVQAARPMHRKH